MNTTESSWVVFWEWAEEVLESAAVASWPVRLNWRPPGAPTFEKSLRIESTSVVPVPPPYWGTLAWIRAWVASPSLDVPRARAVTTLGSSLILARRDVTTSLSEAVSGLPLREATRVAVARLEF